jgi:hypothetical protein
MDDEIRTTEPEQAWDWWVCKPIPGSDEVNEVRGNGPVPDWVTTDGWTPCHE